MKRQALIVGINQYAFDEDLPTPAADAEAVAQLLEKYGDFEVHRLPTQDAARRVAPDEQLKLEELEEAIIRLFQPKSGIIPETALLFFAGHGLQRERDGETEGFLITSEARPGMDKGLFSLKMLRQLLQDSLVRQQLVWLDCCHSGELFNFTETDLGEKKRGRDRCFIAASREFQVAYGGVLTPALLQGLDPTNQPDGWVTNYSLTDFIEQALKDAPQHSACRNTGGQIILTGKHGVRGNICPYKGLEFFDFNPEQAENAEDPKYFYGRTELTEKLWKKVRSSNFLALLGASGSGKSSVVRAGLLYQLYLGEKIRGSNRWKIYKPFTPGEHPLRSLEQVIGVKAEQLEPLIKAAAAERVVLVVDQFEEVFTQCRDEAERQQFFKCLMGGVERLGNKLCLVLVMRDDFQHKCAEQDYAGLATKIDQNLVRVKQMSEEELTEAITKPAEQVELEIDRELVNHIIADVSDSPGDLPLLQYTLTQLWEKYRFKRLTLSEYNHPDFGGVKKALENHANQVYKSLSIEQQKAAKRIFLEMTRLGEDEQTPNTRQQVRQQDLVNSQQSEALVNQVVQRLAKEKLVVTSEQEVEGNEQEVEGKRVAVVNIAHEALIRHWNLLREWLKENGEVLRTKQDFEDAAKEWRDNKKRGEEAYLLQGIRLAAAEDYLQRFADNVPLSNLAQEYIRRSIKHRERTKRNLIITVTAVFLALSGLAGWALIEGEDARIRADSASSESVFASDRKLEALVASIRAGKRLKNPLGAIGAKADTRIQAVTALQQSVYGITELNRFEGHSGSVLDVSISPDGQLLASAGEDGTVKIWNSGGKLIYSFPKEKTFEQAITVASDWKPIYAVTFSPDGSLIALSEYESGQHIRLIDREGNLVKTLDPYPPESSRAPIGYQDTNTIAFSSNGTIIANNVGGKIKVKTIDGKLISVLSYDDYSGGNQITHLRFSPDNQVIASSDIEGTIRLWNLEGKLLNTLQHSEVKKQSRNQSQPSYLEREYIQLSSVVFSPDNKIIATAGVDGWVKMWQSNGQLIKQIKAHKTSINSITFSPDSVFFATASSDNTVKLWARDGRLLKIIIGHTARINKVIFAPDGKSIFTASNDGTVRNWSLSSIPISRISHNRAVKDIEFSPDGKVIATVDENIKLWSLEGNLLTTLEGSNNISFSQNEKILASTINGEIKIWKLIQKPDKSLTTEHFTNKSLNKTDDFSPITRVKFSPNNHLITIVGTQGALRKLILLDEQNQIICNLSTDDHIEDVEISPDGQDIVLYSKPTTKVYTHKEGLKLFTVSNLNGEFIPDEYSTLLGYKASFSDDAKLIVTAGEDGVVRLFKRDGSLISNLTGHSKKVTDVSFSPDSQMIASASEDGTVKLWSRNGSLIKTLEHSGSVNSLSFRPDGKTLATAIDNGTVLLWNLDLDDLLARGCTWARGYLENNSSISKEDRNLCKGVKPPQ
jgi:WD40 repeat protein